MPMRGKSSTSRNATSICCRSPTARRTGSETRRQARDVWQVKDLPRIEMAEPLPCEAIYEATIAHYCVAVTNLYVESLTDRMAGVEKQDHDPGVEQQLQANRLVKEPGQGYRQKITERHTN